MKLLSDKFYLLSAITKSGDCYTSDISFFKQICLPKATDVGGLGVVLINFLLGLAGSLAVLALVVGGIRYINSAGDPERTEEAKKTITNALMGVAVIILALVLLNTVLAFIKK